MRKSSAAGLVVAAAAASVVAVTTPALASAPPANPSVIPFSSSVSGAVTGTAGTTKLHDNNTGKDVTCTSSTVKATLNAKSVNNTPKWNNTIGTITSVTFTGCSAFGISLTVKASANDIVGTGFSSPTTSAFIAGIHSTLSGLGCSATIDGTNATSNDGTVNGSYNNTTGNLTTSGGTLQAFNVSGCLGNLNNNDSVTFLGTYAISPAPTITSP